LSPVFASKEEPDASFEPGKFILHLESDRDLWIINMVIRLRKSHHQNNRKLMRHFFFPFGFY
jgi:hypothetical protein